MQRITMETLSFLEEAIRKAVTSQQIEHQNTMILAPLKLALGLALGLGTASFELDLPAFLCHWCGCV